MALYEINVEAEVQEITGLTVGTTYFLQNSSARVLYVAPQAAEPEDIDAPALIVYPRGHLYFSVASGEKAWIWTRGEGTVRTVYTEAVT